jgi:hypothetical protein
VRGWSGCVCCSDYDYYRYWDIGDITHGWYGESGDRGSGDADYLGTQHNKRM